MEKSKMARCNQNMCKHDNVKKHRLGNQAFQMFETVSTKLEIYILSITLGNSQTQS